MHLGGTCRQAVSCFCNEGVECFLAGANHTFKGQDLAVVGGGDTAAEEAIFLTKYGKLVRLPSCG